MGKFNRSKTKKIKRRNSKKSQKGGKKIGKGGFGCVVKPYIKCTKDLNPNTHVSKLIFKGLESKMFYEEIKISNLIKKIDDKNEYFITYIEMCDLKKIQDRNNIIGVKYEKNNNNLFKISNKNNINKKDKDACYIDFSKKPKNMIMIDGGIDLSKIIKSDSTNFLKHQTNIKINIKEYFKRLLIGLKKLHYNYIIHKDIKPLNILVNYKTESTNNSSSSEKSKITDHTKFILRFIDFGLSKSMNDVKNINDVTSAGTKSYVPPEIVILHKVNTFIKKKFNSHDKSDINNLKTLVIKTINNEMMKGLKKKNIHRTTLKMNPVEKNNYFYKNCIFSENDIKSLINLVYKSIKNNSLFEKYTTKINGYIYKGDIFAMGVTFFLVYDLLGVHDDNLLDLIRNMLKCDPNERYNINQCLDHIFFR